MIPYLGDFVEDDVVYIMFNTFSSDDPSASCTITNLISTDVHIHKDDGLTQRCNAAGITVSVNFDGITGSHMIKIDTSDNTVAGFWVTGHDYFVRIEGTTIDAATINAVVGHFSIQNRYTRGTDSAALAATALSDATWTDAKAVHIDANISSRNATTPPTVTAIRQEMDTNSTKMAPSQTLNDYKATGFSTHSAANVWAVGTRALTDKAGFALSTAGIKAIWDQLVNALTTVDTIGKLLVDNINATISSRNATTPPTVIQIRQEMDANSTKMAPSQTLNDYKATGFNTTVPDAAGVAPTAAEIKTAIEAGGSSLAQILADTGELQTDWHDGGRLDLILDIIAADTTTDIPGLILKYTQLLARSDAAIATDNATELTAINADGGSGAGDFSNQTDGIEAIRDQGDAAWITGGGGAAPTVEQIRAEMDTNSTKMAPSQTLADYKATGFSVPNEYDAVIAALALEASLTAMKGATFAGVTDSLEAIRNRGDAAWVTGGGGAAPTVEQIRTEMDNNSTKLAKIKSIANFIRTKLL